MTSFPRRVVLSGGGLMLGTLGRRAAHAQTRADTLRYICAGVVNTLDPVMLGGTAEATALGACTYDRLLRFGRLPSGDGSYVFDFDHIEGELAERYEVSPDGLAITLYVRPGTAWHDGSPVTAADVKWSLDRAVSAPTMSKAQLATGSLTQAGQIRILDDRTIRIALDRPDRLALPNLATSYAPMFNSGLAKRYATAADPWATAWLKDNVAGGGAYRVQSFTPGISVVLSRNDAWRNGTMPFFARAILQTVPDAATRSALMERGDADITTGLQPVDLKALETSQAVRIVSTPMPTGFGALIFNTQMPPFDRPAVRRALAMAVPYEAIFDTAIDRRGVRLFGADWTGQPPTADFPQALPLHTDLVAAKRLLAEAGYPDGFATTLSYGVARAAFADPAAALIQESFSAIGVTLTIAKLADAQMATAVNEKRLPLLLERSLALFPSTEYFFRIFLSGNSRWNFSSWNDPAVNALLAQARYEPDQARYQDVAKTLIGIMAAELPMATIWKPSFDVVLGRGIQGFTTWCNYGPDFRDLCRA